MTTHITNTNSLGETKTIDELGVSVAFGETVEVDDELARKLLDDGAEWAHADAYDAQRARAAVEKAELFARRAEAQEIAPPAIAEE
jgi:hypothetical protein